MNKLLLFLSLISIFGYSQNNFKESSIVFKDGTVKKGFVNYVKTRNTPQEFKYKSSIESEIIVLDSTEIESVEISEITKFVFRENIEVNFEFRDLNSISSKKEKYLDRFIEIVVDGEYSLCNYSDNEYEMFYYFGNDLKLKPLKITKFYDKEDKLFLIEDYKNEMIAKLSNNNPEIIKEIKKARLNSYDLSRVFYLVNKKDLSILEAKKDEGFINLNLFSELNFNSFKGNKVDFGNKTLLGYGLELEYVFPYYNNLFALELIPSVYVYKGEGVYNNTIPLYYSTEFVNGSQIEVAHYDPNNGRKVFINSTIFSSPFNLKLYPFNKKLKIFTSFTLFNFLSFGNGKMNFENESSVKPSVLPPFYGFFEIGGTYKKFGFSIKRLRKIKDDSQSFSGYAVSLKYSILNSKKNKKN